MTRFMLLLAMLGPQTQTFGSLISGTWQGTYCGNSTTTFRFDARTPQRSWVSEHWCNSFTCGDLDYMVTEVDRAHRSFTATAVQGTGFSTGGFDIRFQVSADGRSMTGTYVGHPRCTSNQLSKVSSDPGSGPVFAASITPLPDPSQRAVRASGIPDDVRRAPMADDQGSLACLVIGTETQYRERVNGYGTPIGTDTDNQTRWIYNRCSHAVGYSMAMGDAWGDVGSTPHKTLPPGITHVWYCSFVSGENPFGMRISRLSGCTLQPVQ